MGNIIGHKHSNCTINGTEYELNGEELGLCDDGINYKLVKNDEYNNLVNSATIDATKCQTYADDNNYYFSSKDGHHLLTNSEYQSLVDASGVDASKCQSFADANNYHFISKDGYHVLSVDEFNSLSARPKDSGECMSTYTLWDKQVTVANCLQEFPDNLWDEQCTQNKCTTDFPLQVIPDNVVLELKLIKNNAKYNFRMGRLRLKNKSNQDVGLTHVSDTSGDATKLLDPWPSSFLGQQSCSNRPSGERWSIWYGGGNTTSNQNAVFKTTAPVSISTLKEIRYLSRKNCKGDGTNHSWGQGSFTIEIKNTNNNKTVNISMPSAGAGQTKTVNIETQVKQLL